jgi:hypothetical protein
MKTPSGVWARLNPTFGFIAIIAVIIILQDNLSESVRVGQLLPENLRGLLALALTNRIWTVVKILILVPAVVFWLLDNRRALRIALLASLILLTFELLASVMFLVLGLAADTSRGALGLVRDTLIVGVINILVFCLWYWLLDAAPLQREPQTTRPNDFLFSVDSNPTPKFAGWQPALMDYLFLAFTTSTAFGPTDTLPLTRRAKFLMLLQAAFSLVIIVVLAGRALSILR